MIAKVIIKRRFVDGKTPQILALLNELRSRAMNQQGYISGETLTKSGYPNNMVVIASWQSPEDWQAWEGDPERREIQKNIDALLDEKTTARAYLYG